MRLVAALVAFLHIVGDMMLYYVTMAESLSPALAKSIVRNLQIADRTNTYLSPKLALSHVSVDDVGVEDYREMRYDLMTACDGILIASSVDDTVAGEIDLAERLRMEVRYIGDDSV